MGVLDGRVALVTGSSRGIGRAIALAFGAEGCQVAVNYLHSREHALEVRQRIERMHPSGSIAVQADVTLERDVRRLVDQTLAAFGRLHILVNNAGCSHRCAFLEMSPDEWDRMIAGNLTSTFLCTRFAAPHILKNGWGRIINIASTSGLTGGTSGAHYAAAKGGVIALTRALKTELSRSGITVNAIVPSKIDTDMLRASIDEREERTVLGRIPVGRFGTPEEIASLALYLASEAAGYITGETIVASGGYP